MEAIILAGGFGKRLRSIIQDVPKPMGEVAGKPFLFYILENLKNKGFSKVIISTYYLSEKISEYFGEYFENISLEYIKDPFPLGTGGAIKNALKLSTRNHIYVLNGDTFVDFDYQKMEALWRIHKKPIMVVKSINSEVNKIRYGTLKIENSLLKGFKEKNSYGDFINAGCYLLPKSFLDEWEEFKPFSFEKEHLEAKINNLKIFCYETKGLFIDIGIPDDFKCAQKLFKNKK